MSYSDDFVPGCDDLAVEHRHLNWQHKSSGLNATKIRINSPLIHADSTLKTYQ